MGWWIAGGILLFLALLMFLDITAYVQYTETLSLSVGILGLRFPILPADKKKKEGKKSRRKKKTEQKSSGGKPAPKKKKGDIKGIFDTVMQLLIAGVPPLMKLLQKTRMVKLQAEILAGGPDAAEIALEYGKISALFYNGYAVLSKCIRVRTKKVEIACDFLLPQTRQDISFRLKWRVGEILWAVLRIGFRFIVHTIKKDSQKEEEASGKAAPSSAPAEK